jgi:hypothetical protein
MLLFVSILTAAQFREKFYIFKKKLGTPKSPKSVIKNAIQ